MQTLIHILGFTTLGAVIWNTLAYLAFIAIIIGVFSERYRNILITSGAGILALYAGRFLGNQLFATLQTLIVVSGLLSIKRVSKLRVTVAMIVITIAAYLFLIISGAIINVWALMGSFGLLGIAFGLIVLPKSYGFLLMAFGGVLLVIYAFVAAAWVFFLLNIFFFIANIRAWQKQN